MLRGSEIGAVSSGGPFGQPPQSKYENLISLAREVPPATTVVAHPRDETSLRGAVAAAELGIIVPILVEPVAKITAVAKQHGIDTARYELADAPRRSRAKAVELIRESRGELLMKGGLHTDELMRAVTSATTGLRTARRISHVFIMDVPSHAETLFITDAAINIFPDLEAKRDIVQNAIDLFTYGGLGTPRVAILSAVETVTPKIPSPSTPRRSERWPSVARSPAGFSTGRLLSIMPLARRRPRSKASNPPSLAARKFSWCPISRRAICLSRNSHSRLSAAALGHHVREART